MRDTSKDPDYAAMTDEELLERAVRLSHTFPRNSLIAHILARYMQHVLKAGAAEAIKDLTP